MNIFLKKMMYLLPIPIFIVAVNYFVEKTNLLKNNARDAALYLWQGYNIANAYTCGDSCIKEFYVKNAMQGKDILIFGSSRSLGINNKLFPGKTFFNMSVTDGRLENFICFYFLWREKGLIPAHVILGLDVWLLKSKSQCDLMAVIKDKLIEADSDFSSVFDSGSDSNCDCGCKQTTGEALEFAQRLVSIDLFRNSLMYGVNVLLHGCGFRGVGVFYPTKENFADSEVMLADGSINYGLVRRSRSVEEVNRQVLSGIKEKGFSHLNDFEKLDVDMVKLFEIFIKLLLRDNVSITFFLTPYHPKAYDLLKVSEKNKIVCTVRDYFKEVARKNNIKVLGDFDPAINNLEDSDFFDEFHPKESAMQKVFGKFG
ncbi:MAG: hypothetical protein WCS92_01590 [Candidatus Babeliales bacterium]|jgi:hypothetical protein